MALREVSALPALVLSEKKPFAKTLFDVMFWGGGICGILFLKNFLGCCSYCLLASFAKGPFEVPFDKFLCSIKWQNVRGAKEKSNVGKGRYTGWKGFVGHHTEIRNSCLLRMSVSQWLMIPVSWVLAVISCHAVTHQCLHAPAFALACLSSLGSACPFLLFFFLSWIPSLCRTGL